MKEGSWIYFIDQQKKKCYGNNRKRDKKIDTLEQERHFFIFGIGPPMVKKNNTNNRVESRREKNNKPTENGINRYSLKHNEVSEVSEVSIAIKSFLQQTN